MDDRVVPLHARKFVAALQAADAGTNPIPPAQPNPRRPRRRQADHTSRSMKDADLYAFLARGLWNQL
jgi:prolyl oligopeptidase PreP (S9A serine peptidase family)